MTVVTSTTISGGLVTLDRKNITRYFKEDISNAAKKRWRYTRENLKTLPSYSLLSECADAWNLLNGTEKTAWASAAEKCDSFAYNLFIQDKSYRIINSIAGNAVPVLEHQYKVGHIEIPNSAGHFLYRQVGTRNFTGDGELKISYKSDLVSENGGSEYVKVRFKYTYMVGAIENTDTTEIVVNLSNVWEMFSAVVTYNAGQNNSIELEIEGDLVHGDLWFDNFNVEAVEGIITKEPFDNRPDLFFDSIIVPAGVVMETVYPDD